MVEIEAGKLILGAIILAVAGLYLSQNPDVVSWIFSGFGGEEVGQEVSQDADGYGVEEFVIVEEVGGEEIQQIIVIENVLLEMTFPDALNTSGLLTSPGTVYVWKPGQVDPTTVTPSNNVANATLAPGSSVTYAAGGSATSPSGWNYYWEKGSTAVGTGRTSHEHKLYRIAGSTGATIQVFDSSFNELSGGAANLTVGSGQDQTLEVKIDVTGEYTSVKRPHVCQAYNDTIFNGIKLTGLKEVDAPTRLVSTLDQCFDTAMTYFTYADPSKLYEASVDIVTGQNPDMTAVDVLGEAITIDNDTTQTLAHTYLTSGSFNVSNSTGLIIESGNYTLDLAAGTVTFALSDLTLEGAGVANYTYTPQDSRIDWYLIDKDIWFKDGIEYFVNPIDRSDMGSTTAWTTRTWFA